ncbi:MAG: carboxypeptidase-like regulatory domain-containing protein [Carboxylicivirga sp.]|jgi:hypothetical protein|nr:carboxypeptidase-like regulatory domain-containing protein [Carboxylicivirga sp.]
MMVISYHSFAGITVQERHLIVNESGISLSQIIRTIEKQVSAEFVYKTEDLKKYRNLKVNEEGSIENVLNAILSNTDLKLQVRGDVYVISKKEPVTKQPIQQEKKTIKGGVKDKQGVPLPGVSVVIKGTTVGTVTDSNGSYSIEVDNESAVLVFSFVGMESQ